MTTQDQRRLQTRSKLLESGTELFSTRGYHNTHVMEIVSHAGVSAGTFYKYFEDKRAIYRALMDNVSDNLRTQVQDVRARALAVPLENQLGFLSTAFEIFFDSIIEQRALYMILLRGGFGVDEETDNLVWKTIEGFTADIAADLDKAARLGILERTNYDNVARIVTGMCFHIGHAMLMEGEPSPKQAANTCTRFLLGGLMGLATESIWSAFSMTDFQALLREKTGLSGPKEQ